MNLQWKLCTLNSGQWREVVPSGDCSFVIPVTKTLRVCAKDYGNGHIVASIETRRDYGRTTWNPTMFSWPDSIDAALLRCIGYLDNNSTPDARIARAFLLKLLERKLVNA